MDLEKKVKCVKCQKDISMQEGVKTPQGVVCNSCIKKNKLKRALIFLAVLLLILLGFIGYCTHAKKNKATGFEGVTNIQDSTNVIVEKPAEVFVLETAVAQSNPVIAGQTVNDIESFKRVFAENLQESEQNNANYIIIPGISVFFDLNSHDVSLDGKNLLKEYAKTYLQTNKQAKILVTGYACNLGSEKINDLISRKRAESVKKVLVSCEVPENNIETLWVGKSRNKDFSYPDIKDYRRVIIFIK